MDKSQVGNRDVIDSRFCSWTAQCVVVSWERHFAPTLPYRGQATTRRDGPQSCQWADWIKSEPGSNPKII